MTMRAQTKSATILAHLGQAPEGLTLAELAEFTGSDKKKTSAMLTWLRGRGRVAHVSLEPGHVGKARPRWRLAAPAAEHQGQPEGSPPRPPKASARRKADGNGASRNKPPPEDVEAEACAALIDADAADDTPMWEAVMTHAAALGCAVTYCEDAEGAFSFKMVPCAPDKDGDA